MCTVCGTVFCPLDCYAQNQESAHACTHGVCMRHDRYWIGRVVQQRLDITPGVEFADTHIIPHLQPWTQCQPRGPADERALRETQQWTLSTLSEQRLHDMFHIYVRIRRPRQRLSSRPVWIFNAFSAAERWWTQAAQSQQRLRGTFRQYVRLHNMTRADLIKNGPTQEDYVNMVKRLGWSSTWNSGYSSVWTLQHLNAQAQPEQPIDDVPTSPVYTLPPDSPPRNMEIDSSYDASEDEDDNVKALLEPIPPSEMSLGMHASGSGQQRPSPPTPPTPPTPPVPDHVDEATARDAAKAAIILRLRELRSAKQAELASREQEAQRRKRDEGPEDLRINAHGATTLELKPHAERGIDMWLPGMPFPSVLYAVLLYGGRHRAGDLAEWLFKLSKGNVVGIVIDTAVGGYAHDLRDPEVIAAVHELATHDKCITVHTAHPCGPWCPLRGQGKGPEPLFSHREPDGIKEHDGQVRPAAQRALDLLATTFDLLEASIAAHKEVTFEHPVGRREGMHSIEGRESHSTLWETTLGEKFLTRCPLRALTYDQCSPPSCAPSQKTTQQRSTTRLHRSMMEFLGPLHCDGRHRHTRNLLTVNGDGTRFETEGSEEYTSGLCKLYAAAILKGSLPDVTLTCNAISADAPTITLNKEHPENALFFGKVEFSRPATIMLLDSGSDAHIVPRPECYLSMQKPDLGRVRVGKEGQYLHFRAMGPCLVGILLKATKTKPQRVAAFVLDKCYLPEEGDGNTFIMSTGRAWMTQGIRVWEAGVDELCIGEHTAKFARRNFSPVIKILVPAQKPALRITLDMAGCFGHHVTGAPHTSASSWRLKHWRLVHGDDQWMRRLFPDQAGEVHRPCHHCRLMKTKAPESPPATGNQSTEGGDLAHMDIWEYSSHPATATGWTHIMGIVDDHLNLMHGEGMTQPNGKRAAKFVRDMFRIWAMLYKCKLKRIRFDNDSIFDCNEVIDVMAELKIGREFSVPYMHFQLRIERHWQTMKNDGKTILSFVRNLGRTKSLFIHACLHSIMVRRECYIAPGHKISQFTKATGIVANPDKFRIFGCNMYAILMPEQRRAYGFDKADPTTKYGIYVGNSTECKGWLCATPGKLVLAGAAIIDEVTAIKNTDSAAGDEIRHLTRDAWSADTVYDADGKQIGTTTDANVCQDAAPETTDPLDSPPPPQPQPPQRPQRTTKAIQRLDPATTAPQRAQAPAPQPRQRAETRLVLVPRTLWPSYPCDEHDGKGWTGQVVSENNGRLVVHFPNARNHVGQPFRDVHLQSGAVVPIDEHGNPDWSAQDAAMNQANDKTTTLHALQEHEFTIEPNPPHMALASHMASHDAGTGADDATATGDRTLMRMAVELDPAPREQMLLLAAQAARQTKVAMVLVTLASGTVWMPKPNSVEQARGLPNWQRWQMQMGGFVDKCRSIDGLFPVDKEVTAGSVLANLKWVFTYKPVGDDPGLDGWYVSCWM